MLVKSLKAYAAGCAQSAALQVVAALGVLGTIALCVSAAALLPLPRGVDRTYLSLGAFFVAIFVAIGGALALAVAFVVRRGRKLDAAIEPLGLIGRAYLTNGRQYHGSYGGRQVDAYFYRGPNFDLYISTPLQTRFGIVRADRAQRAVARLFNKQPFDPGDPDLSRHSVFALDETWARSLLREPAARTALLRLTDEDAPGAGAFETRQVLLQPDGLLLRLLHTRTHQINEANVRQWLNDLLTVAQAAERLPAPQVTATASGLERKAQVNRDAFLLPAVLIVLGLTFGLGLCAVVPVVFIVFSELR